MKKLMFATALAASVAAFADPLNKISFEGYELGSGPIIDDEEVADGDISPTKAGHTYFFFTNTADGANSSYVTNYESGTTFAAGHRPQWYVDQAGTIGKYLALDTEGGTLWRNINHNDDNFATRLVDATGTYLDTLVQFTVTEDDAPTTSASDKLAIWLGVSTNAQGEVTGTNLMVRAGYLDDNGSDSFVTATDFILSTAEPIEAGRWYRLTVKAIGDVTACVAKNSENYDSGYMGFEIYLDGVQLAATTATISTDYLDVAKGSDEFAWLDETNDAAFLAYLGSGKVFPSLEGKVAAYAIQGVGFQGTGAVDEIVWTEEDPISGSGSSIDFTLTWGDGVTAVKYVLSTDMATTNTLTSGTAEQLPVGDGTATIELIPTLASGYDFEKVTMGETVISTLTFPIPGVDTTATLSAKMPTYLTNADATIKAKYDTWKGTYKPDTSSQWETAFLLNMDPETPVASGTALLKIASITEVSGGWELEIVSDATTLTADTNSDGIVGNGYLAITYAADLATLTSGGTTVNLPVTVTSGAIKVTVPTASGAKFMKAKLSATAEPQN